MSGTGDACGLAYLPEPVAKRLLDHRLAAFAGDERKIAGRLLEPIGNIPPAEAEGRYYAMMEQPAMAASNETASGKPGAVQ